VNRKRKINSSRWTSSRRKLYNIIDSLSFSKIFVVWLLLVLLFGLIYFVFGNANSYLLVTQTNQPVSSVQEAVYYSFITATTTGFGDIVPTGLFRLLAIIEAVVGLLVLAMVTSKLVSIKQNIILEEIYELTFSEKVNRLRSSLLYFRQNLHNLIHKTEDDGLQKQDIDHLYTLFYSFRETLEEITKLVKKQRTHAAIKQIDDINAGLLVNSIIQTTHRTIDLITIMDDKDIIWRTSKNTSFLKTCIDKSKILFKEVKRKKIINSDSLHEVAEDFESAIQQIEAFLEKN